MVATVVQYLRGERHGHEGLLFVAWRAVRRHEGRAVAAAVVHQRRHLHMPVLVAGREQVAVVAASGRCACTWGVTLNLTDRYRQAYPHSYLTANEVIRQVCWYSSSTAVP